MRTVRWRGQVARLRGGPCVPRGMHPGVMLLGILWALGVCVSQAPAQAPPLTIQPATGHVGVGTASPAYPLQVEGAVGATHLYSTGAVGIGTGAPATGLHVVSTPPGGTPWIGSLLLEPSTHPYSGALSIKSTLSSGVTNRVWTLLSGYATDAPGIFRIYDGNVHQDRIVIDLDGKVGIGTTAPATGLHLVKTPIQGSPWIGSVLLEPATHPFTAALSIKSTNTSGATNRIWSLLSGFGSDGYGDFRIYDSVAQRDGLRIDDYGQVFVNSLYAQGTLYGSVKYFQIPHPQNPDKKLLTHSSLEGPEIGVTYRGEAQLQEGEVSVGLPAYFEALTRSEQRTVHLTPVEGWSPLYVVSKVREGRFVVRTAKGGDPNQRFYWEVRAVRADVGLLQAESDVPTGHPIVRMGAPVTRTE